MNTTDGQLKDAAVTAPTRVTGFLPPIATPLLDGRLDLQSLHRQLDYLGDHVAGYLVGGSVGEVVSLSLDEREQLIRACAEHASGRHQLAVAISDNCIEHSRRLADVAGEVGAALLMVSCPNYYANDLSMLTAYFGAVGDLAPADICLYDNPIASHTSLSVSDIAALAAAVPRLTHVKVTDTAVEKVAALRAETDLVVHAGDDVVLWHQLTRGAEGAMVALPMIYPERASGLWSALQAGDTEAAWAEYEPALRFFHVALGAPDFVAAVKTALHHRGVIASPEMRLPLVPPTRRRHAEIVAAL